MNSAIPEKPRDVYFVQQQWRGQCRLIQWARRARAQGPQASRGPKQPMR